MPFLGRASLYSTFTPSAIPPRWTAVDVTESANPVTPALPAMLTYP